MSKWNRLALYFLLTILVVAFFYINRYYEKEAITFPKVMFLQGSENLRSLPYENADSLKKIEDAYVILHSEVHNNEGEAWALVEFCDGVNMKYYGYVKSIRLSARPHQPLYHCDKESISGVAIGDGLEKALVKFGNQYEVIKSEVGLNYSFNENNGCVVALIDSGSFTVRGISVNIKG